MGGGQFILQNGLLALEDGSADGLLLEAHIDQGVLLGLQLPDQSSLGVPNLRDGLLADGHQCLDRLRPALHLLAGELDWSLHVVALDGLLDQLGAQMPVHRAARALHPPDAEVVGVTLAAFAAAKAEDQPPAALAAEQRAPQVVLVLLRTLTGETLFIEPGLHDLERLRVNQRLVATLKDLLVRRTSLVDDQAQVVAVAEDALEGRGIDLLRWPVATGPGAQPELMQLIGKLTQGVFAGGVELERQRQEVMTVRIRNNRGDPATVGQPVHIVEIAEVCPTVGAANTGLLFQPAFNVLAGLHRLKLVLGGNHALVQEGGGAVLTGHRLGDRDQARPCFADNLAGLPVIDGVACPPRQAPDDHIVHMGSGVRITALQLVQHLQKACPLVQINVRRAAGIAELVHDLSVKTLGLLGGPDTLGIDAQAILAVVGFHLAVG